MGYPSPTHLHPHCGLTNRLKTLPSRNFLLRAVIIPKRQLFTLTSNAIGFEFVAIRTDTTVPSVHVLTGHVIIRRRLAPVIRGVCALVNI